MKYRAVILDLFCTLVVLETVGVDRPDTRDLAGIPATRWDPVWQRYDDGRQRGQFASNAEVLARVAEELDEHWTPERCTELAAQRWGSFRMALLAIEPDTLRALGELRALGLRLGLLSDAVADEVEAWPESPLAPYFDAALFSCHQGVRKPELEFFRRLLGRLDVEPADCLYVGDGGGDEHRAARALGMTPVLLTHFMRRYWPWEIAERAPLCDYVAADLCDVVTLVQG